MANVENLTMDKVAGIMADFMNGVTNGQEHSFEKAIHAFKNNFEMTDEQEAMVRNSLFHLETIAQNCQEDFNLEGFVGLECNIIFWTLAGDWSIMITRTLGDSESFTQESIGS